MEFYQIIWEIRLRKMGSHPARLLTGVFFALASDSDLGLTFVIPEKEEKTMFARDMGRFVGSWGFSCVVVLLVPFSGIFPPIVSEAQQEIVGGKPDCNRSERETEECSDHPQKPPDKTCSDSYLVYYVLEGNALDHYEDGEQSGCHGDWCQTQQVPKSTPLCRTVEPPIGAP
jgi:hypothetical protein